MFLKPEPGAAAAIIAKRRRRIRMAEQLAKKLSKERDGYVCRRCLNPARSIGEFESAHIDDKGMGGDQGLRSSLPSDYVTLCHECHRGPRSVHSGHVAIVCLSPERGDGPVQFEQRNYQGEPYRLPPLFACRPAGKRGGQNFLR